MGAKLYRFFYAILKTLAFTMRREVIVRFFGKNVTL